MEVQKKKKTWGSQGKEDGRAHGSGSPLGELQDIPHRVAEKPDIFEGDGAWSPDSSH